MTDWFRSWHGAPTDPKWRTIARRASVRPGDVFAVVSSLWDRASQAQDRGSIAGYDFEIIADGLGYEPDEVERVIAALIDKGVIADDRIVAWEKYQPKREDEGAADRAKQHRERQKQQSERDQTHANATARNRTTDTEEIRNTPQPPEAGGDEGDIEIFKEKVWAVCPKHPGSVLIDSYTEFAKLDMAGKTACIDGAARLHRAHDELVASGRPAPIAKNLRAWIAKRGWEGWESPAASAEFMVLDASDPLVSVINAPRDSPYHVGKSGKITVPRAEYERAMSARQAA